MGDEPVRCAAHQAPNSGAGHAGSRDHPARVKLDPLGLHGHVSGGWDLRHRRQVDGDPGALEQARHSVTGGAPEDRHRPHLRGHNRQLELVDAHAVGTLCCHQREFVERERPHRSIRKQERDALRVALLDVLDDTLIRLVGFRVTERGHVLERLDLAPADRNQERVVAKALLAAGVHDLRLAVHPGERVLEPARVVLGHDPPELVPTRRPERKRLANRKRPHEQLIVRRDDVDVDGTAQKPAQPQQTFDSGDPAAAHHHPEVAHGARSISCLRSVL
jgi:hypothetical protein